MMRIAIPVLLVTLAASSLGAQTGAAASSGGVHPSSARTLPAPVPDPRLLVEAAEAEDAARPGESEAWRRAVTRPRWHYPAIDAGIGVAAGVIHANAITQGDYVGLPMEPMILLPVAYGAVGAFLGLLIDSSERERAARR
ncbi:MAG TPA: hypothetical protein VF006_10200 [Longimicrobium sp.]